MMMTFNVSWLSFYSKFNAWKEKDTIKLIDSLVESWMDLEVLWVSVKDQTGADVEWQPKIAAQQKMIHSKIARLGQEAADKLKEAQSKYRADAELKIEKDPLASKATSMHDIPSLQKTKSLKDTVNKAEPIIVPKQDAMRNGVPEMTSPVTSPSQAIKGYGGMLSNEQLAHELILDPEFVIKAPEKSELEMQVTQMAKKAFFDSIRQDLQKDGKSVLIIELLKEIKEKLLSIVSSTGKQAIEINEKLDMTFIQQQMDRGVLNVESVLIYIVQKMALLCAPKRDQEIRELSNETDVLNAIEKILVILDEMKLDLANYKLQTLKPQLQLQAVDYERSKFNQALEAGAVTLDRTKQWLQDAVKELKQVNESRNPENIESLDNTVRFEDAYNFGFLGLVFGNSAVSFENAPETLSLDLKRVFELQNEIQLLTIIASLVMLTSNILPQIRGHRPILMSLKESLSVLLKKKDTRLEHVSEHIKTNLVKLLSKDNMPFTLSDQVQAMITTMVDKTLSAKDPVYSIVKRRIHGIVKSAIDKGQIRMTSLASHGLDILEKELDSISRKCYLLAKHNKQVHSEHYNSILRSLI